MAKRRTMKECEAQLRILRAARSSTAIRKGAEKGKSSSTLSIYASTDSITADVADRGAARRLRRERKLDRNVRRVQDRVHTLTLRKVEGKIESLALADPIQPLPDQSVESSSDVHKSIQGGPGARQFPALRTLNSIPGFNMDA